MDFYLLLGVEREATLADIKRAYRRLARKYHPGINPGDRVAEQQFRLIAEAYETLVDPDRRRRYDSNGTEAPAGESVSFGFEGFDFSMHVSGDAAPTFGDLFADVFRQKTDQPRGAERGADLHLTVRLSFDEAMRGGTHYVNVTRLVHCGVCRGVGRVQIPERRCQRCHGTGALRSTRNHMVFSKPCETCNGAGVIAQTVCPGCAGRQVERIVEPIAVNMPPGMQSGARLRLAGKGHDGAHGGDAGDVLIEIQVDPHPRFTRHGDDLHVVVPVAVHEAALGAKIEVPSIDGPARLRVPPGTQSGQRFRLHERGAPSPRDGGRGDLVVEVRVVLPAVLDERSKELLREFGRINNADVRQELT
jgi:molecular chaperone DnaJ